MIKLPFFRKKKNKLRITKLVDITTMNTSDIDIMRYIVYLWEKRNIRHVGYIFVGATLTHGDRWVIYTCGNRRVADYFRDRCPTIIEEEILSISNDEEIIKDLSTPATGLYNGGIPIVKPKQYWTEDDMYFDWGDVDISYIRDQVKM